MSSLSFWCEKQNRLWARSDFSHHAYSVLLLQPILSSVQENLIFVERFPRPALSKKRFHPINVFDGRVKRQREIFVVFAEIKFDF